MHRISNLQQEQLFDPFFFLGPHRRRLLETGWPTLFRNYLYEELPADTIKAKFHETQGRPTKEFHTVLGCLVLQQMFDLTDRQVVEALAFDTRWHYALNILNEEDDSKYLCERTLRTYRSLATELKLDEILFRSMTDKLLGVFQVPTEKQRLDSTHIFSDMRRLSRLGIFVRTIKKFLRALKREHGRILKRDVDADLVSRYLDPKKGCFSYVKPSDSAKTLQHTAEDLLVLVAAFRTHATVGKMKEYELLVRVLDEQCEVTGEGTNEKVIVKDPKTVSSTSLQNPSDPDTTYDGHKGQGYQAQVMETYQDEEVEETATPDLITHVNVQSACESDGPSVPVAIEDTRERDCAPTELLADGAYGSDENVQALLKEGVDLVAPALGKSRNPECLTAEDFVFDEASDEVVACPVGEGPDEVEQGCNGTVRLYFDEDRCERCPYEDFCCVGRNEEGRVLKCTAKQRRLARRRAAEESAEFRDKYRWRSGIEATNAHLKRVFHMNRLRVRGLANVRYVVTLKVLAWNIQQAARAQKARILAGFLLGYRGLAQMIFCFHSVLHAA